MKKNTIVLSVLGLLFSVAFLIMPNFAPVQAQITPTCTVNCAQSGLNDIGDAFPNRDQNINIKDLAKTIINYALYFAAIIAVLAIIYGGFLYITSGGNTGQAGKGLATLQNALIGLAIIVLSYIIVQVVYNFLVNRV